MRSAALRKRHGSARRRRRWVAPLAALLLVRAGSAGAATYLPGQAEPDPPTGDTANAAAASEPLRAGSGLRWTFGPWRQAGTASLDSRWLRLADGTRTQQTLLFNDIEFSNYVWQPWFIQLRAGLGLLASHETSRGDAARADASTTGTASGRFSMAVFPLSRFPFELRADVSDSRTRGDILGTDYRSTRLSLNQSWRPEAGNDSLTFGFDHSRLQSVRGENDTVDTLRANALRQLAAHTFEVDASVTLDDRSDTESRSRIAALTARHGYHPSALLQADTMASWNQVALKSGSSADLVTELRQVSSVATWRPREGDGLSPAESPTYVTASARWIEAGARSGDSSQDSRALNATLGFSRELSRAWRVSTAVSGGQVIAEGLRSTSLTGSASLGWTPQGVALGAWRYTPTASASFSATRSSEVPTRATTAVQLTQGLERGFLLGTSDNLTFTLTQSAGALRETQTGTTSRALAHALGLFWQSVGSGASQGYAGVSLSDSRSWAPGEGHFQLVNVQLSQRAQVSRQASWAANLTLQASRSDSSQVDPFSGQLREDHPGWQRFYSGTLTYENQRAFGIPRLRWSSVLAANSAQLERRSEGDIDAPLTRITTSFENRLEYAIGRLETRLSARIAREEGHAVASVFLRVLRRY